MNFSKISFIIDRNVRLDYYRRGTGGDFGGV